MATRYDVDNWIRYPLTVGLNLEDRFLASAGLMEGPYGIDWERRCASCRWRRPISGIGGQARLAKVRMAEAGRGDD